MQDPIYLGDYPEYMKEMLGDRLPRFTPEELAVVTGSSEFYGMNTYTTNLTREGGPTGDEFQGRAEYTFTRPDGTQLGTQAHCAWLQTYAPGFRALLNYLWNRYHMPIYVTENGSAWEDVVEADGAVHDPERTDYLHRHLHAALDAVDAGVPLRGYFAWSLLDNFEWAFGYTKRFGIVHVDYATQQRTPKDSAHWLGNVAKENALLDEDALD